MKRVLFLFLDGVGLGSNDGTINPLVAAELPTLRHLLDGRPPTASTGRFSNGIAHLIPADACMDVPGIPESASGQASILTGLNIPKSLGEHFGPRPDERIRPLLDQSSLFAQVRRRSLEPYFVNAYPQGYFDAIESGRRKLSVVPYAAQVGGCRLLTADDMRRGEALSANFTGTGWRGELGYEDTPLYSAEEAGRRLWQIAEPYHFLFFEHWLTDYLGHFRAMEGAIEILEIFDGFLGGLIDAADLSSTLIIVTSDHGNVEDCSTRRHTLNPALTLVVGEDLGEIPSRIQRLDDFAPVVLDYLSGSS